MNIEDNQYNVLAVNRTMNILESLTGNGLTLTEISQATDIHKATVLRFLHTLESMGYIFRDKDTDIYRLTPKMNRFYVSSDTNQNLKDVIYPYLEQIAGETRETVHLAVLNRNEIMYLEKIESPQSLRVVTSSFKGSRAPLYCTGLGKTLLAFQEETIINQMIKTFDFRKYTDNTITDSEELRKELVRIRENGYSVDNEENEEGIICIAVPIFRNGRIAASISVTGPGFRIMNNREGITDLLKEKASIISDIL